MSADNWAACPKCWMQEQDLKKERQVKCDKAYGKVSISEFIKLKELAELEIALDNTMREDYETYITEDDAIFNITYSASCDVCGFKFTYECTEQVNIG